MQRNIFFLSFNLFLFLFCRSEASCMKSEPSSIDPRIGWLSISKDTIVLDTARIQNIYIDRLDNIYVLYKEGRLTKWTKDTSFSYYNNMGTISSIDVANPFKILLFYRSFQRIVTLDNHLSKVSELDLNSLNRGFICCIAMGQEDEIWMYDQDARSLFLLSNSRDILRKTDPIYYFKESFAPSDIQVLNSKVYLIDPNKGYIEFDIFGQFIGFDTLVPPDPYQLAPPYSEFVWISR